MSAQWSLSGAKRTSRGSPISVAIDPTETCRESCGLLASTVVPGLFLDELDLAQGSKGPTGHLSSGSVSRRSIPVYGVLLADAEDCALDERG